LLNFYPFFKYFNYITFCGIGLINENLKVDRASLSDKPIAVNTCDGVSLSEWQADSALKHIWWLSKYNNRFCALTPWKKH